MLYLNPQEKAFIHWALKYLVSENSVNINPEGRFFFRKAFFEEMQNHQYYLNDFGKKQWLSICKKLLQTKLSRPVLCNA